MRTSLEKVCDELGLSPMCYTPEAATIALQTAIGHGRFAPCPIARLVANTVANAVVGAGIRRGLSLAATYTVTRLALGPLGPLGLILSAAWLLVDIGGPAYRITIPAVIMVAYLRVKRMEDMKRRMKR